MRAFKKRGWGGGVYPAGLITGLKKKKKQAT